jgi:hypothetical protein
MFGMEIILLWTAMLTQKRVVVFAEKLVLLLRIIRFRLLSFFLIDILLSNITLLTSLFIIKLKYRAFPLFVWHRQNWNILRPYVKLAEQDLTDLRSAGVYVAGFTDPSVKKREELYDILVDGKKKQSKFKIQNHVQNSND